MKKNLLAQLLTVCIVIFTAIPTYAYYYQGSWWCNDHQQIILLRDKHNFPSHQKLKYLRYIKSQRKDLLDFLKSTHSIAIVEDLDAYTLEYADKLDTFLDDPINYDLNNNLGFSLDELLSTLKQFVTPLLGFTQCCYALEIPVVDVDFRFFWVDSLSEDLTLKDAYDMCTKALNEIEAYKDSPMLTAIYKRELSYIKPQFSSYKAFYNLVMNSYGMPAKSINRIIDLKALHHIYTNKKYNIIVVLAGGAHIGRIENLLPLLGFYNKSSNYATTGKTVGALNLKQYFRPILIATSSDLAIEKPFGQFNLIPTKFDTPQYIFSDTITETLNQHSKKIALGLHNSDLFASIDKRILTES